MNWSQTKLIFLVAFLILDMYLGYQLYNKRKTADQIPPTVEKTSPKKELALNNIKLPSNMPQESTATYIRGKAISFVEPKSAANPNSGKGKSGGSDNKQNQKNKTVLKPEIMKLEVNDKQQISTDNGTVIHSQFMTPKQVSDTSVGTLSAFLNNHIYNGSDYQFWKMETNQTGMQTAIFVQTYKDHPVFSKGQIQTGTLQLYITDDLITGYRQSYLKLSPFNKSDKQNLINPLKAVDTLFDNEDFLPGSIVESVELSYFNLIANPEKTRVFVPAWHVRVMLPDKKTEKQFFVNAINSEIQTLNQEKSNTGTKQNQSTTGGGTNEGK